MATPPLIVISYAAEDSDQCSRLELHLATSLAKTGLVRVWSERHMEAGTEWDVETSRHIDAAAVIVLLITADFIASERCERTMSRALERRRQGGVAVVPVIARPCSWEDAMGALKELPVAPRDGKPVTTWTEPDEAWLDVVRTLRTTIAYGATADATRPNTDALAVGLPSAPAITTPAQGTATALDTEPPAKATLSSPPPRTIGDIFRRTGHPDITFVAPAQLPKLRAFLREMGQGLVVEGPSGVGKTTAVKQALHDIHEAGAIWLKSKDQADRQRLDAILSAKLTGHLVVDDFHQLGQERQERLAIKMKLIADEDARDAKITVIGVNPVGDSLVREFRDLAGRFEVVLLSKQPDEKIAELIQKGERAANIVFSKRSEFITRAEGSFFTAQNLCYHAALRAGIEGTTSSLTVVNVGPQEVVGEVLQALRGKYHSDLASFASHDEDTPPRGACLILLWLLSQSAEGHVLLSDAARQYPELGPAFDWLQKSNLTSCFEKTPGLSSLFHYNRNAGVLSVEDPQLQFYLRNMGWVEFATKTGHRFVRLDPGRGLMVSAPRHEKTTETGARSVTILHLSDLHFTKPEQAATWYSQLAEDLRELACDKLDLLILSGDVTQRSAKGEYDAAQQFIQKLGSEMKLSTGRVIMVPGNHDLSWDLAKSAYSLHRRDGYALLPPEGHYIAHGTDVLEVREEDAYKRRFEPFGAFYEAITGVPYSSEYGDQVTVHDFPAENLLVVGLNSAWEIDHHFRARASIHDGALSHALNRIRQTAAFAGRTKMAVWHHPLTSPGDDRIKETGFMQRLAQAGFRIVLHGHIHKAENGLYRYDMSADGRKLDVLSAGTFGAPAQDWVPGYPLQYNLLRLSGDSLTVETRKREEPGGAWQPDARWLTGPHKDPLPRYEIKL
jgi:3',5'-cyclic AMP phosphodiesterase CpdA